MKYASLSVDQLTTWACFNNVDFHDAKVSSSIIDEHGSDKGGGLIATRGKEAGEPLLTVPRDLILSKEGVEQCAKTDQRLRELLNATSTFTQKPRLLILVFLVYQMTVASPDADSGVTGATSPLTDYVKFLPKDILLPIFYTQEERDILIGTSLADALSQKLLSLEKEFDQLRRETAAIPWCQSLWWHEDTGILNLGDWKLADAMYRSRALELPGGVGDSMVPVVDMANHSYAYNARFEIDENGNALLVVRDENSISDQQEITIIYGCGGACEMIFSYGFLEDDANNAREVFLSLSMPEDDPLRMAKIRYADEAPGVRLFVDELGQLKWESEFVWWACVNEEDGLDFTVLQTSNGNKELRALWKGQDFEASQLRPLLMADKLRDVFVLRATMLILQRVELQGMQLASTEDHFEQAHDTPNVRPYTWKLINKLRELELNLVTLAYETLEAQKADLLQMEVIQQYLGSDRGHSPGAEIEGDFS